MERYREELREVQKSLEAELAKHPEYREVTKGITVKSFNVRWLAGGQLGEASCTLALRTGVRYDTTHGADETVGDCRLTFDSVAVWSVRARLDAVRAALARDSLSLGPDVATLVEAMLALPQDLAWMEDESNTDFMSEYDVEHAAVGARFLGLEFDPNAEFGAYDALARLFGHEGGILREWWMGEAPYHG